MDYFSLVLDGACIAGQAVMHLLFTGRLTGKKPEAGHFAAYLFLLCLLEGLARAFRLPWLAAIGAELLLLYGINRLWGNPPPVSCAAAILAAYISQLSFGVVNSAEALLFPRLIGRPLLYPLVSAATALSFAVCAMCYRAVRKTISLTELDPITNAGCLLFPALFFFASESYLMRTSYTQTISGSGGPSSALLLEELGKHTGLLVLQILGLTALLCTLYAYRRLCQSFQAQAALQSLTQAARAQRMYIAEAQTRYERTRAFRHDVKNHLSLLDGLLSAGRLEEGRSYLKKLEAASEALSFPCRTGSPVVDTLLGEKLGLAPEIAAEVSLLLPSPCGIDDFDLCVIFANALDNAIAACQSCEGERAIRISGKRQGDFYLLKFENTCSDGPLPPAGTGLANIRSAAEKYHGAVMTEKEGRRFSLSVLLNIS